MLDRFANDESPSDLLYREAFAVGVFDPTGSPYVAGVTLTDQGIILDRRQLSPLVLPWRWIVSEPPDVESRDASQQAAVSMRSDQDEFLTLSIPVKRKLLSFAMDDQRSDYSNSARSWARQPEIALAVV